MNQPAIQQKIANIKTMLDKQNALLQDNLDRLDEVFMNMTLEKILDDPHFVGNDGQPYYTADQVKAAYSAALPQWVKCSDRLPEDDTLYNVCYERPNEQWIVFTTGYSVDFRRFDEGNSNITHWQPLPLPPNQ